MAESIDYIALGTLLITIITTFISPLLSKPLLGIDQITISDDNSTGTQIIIGNFGTSSLHNIKGYISIPEANLTDSQYDLFLPPDIRSVSTNEGGILKASYSIPVIPSLVIMELNLTTTALDRNVLPTVIFFSDETRGVSFIFIITYWILLTSLILLFCYLTYRIYRKTFKRNLTIPSFFNSGI